MIFHKGLLTAIFNILCGKFWLLENLYVNVFLLVKMQKNCDNFSILCGFDIDEFCCRETEEKQELPVHQDTQDNR